MPRDDDDKYFDPTKIVIRDREGNVRDSVEDPLPLSRNQLRQRLRRGESAHAYTDGGLVRVDRPTLWSEFAHRAPVWIVVAAVGVLWFVVPGYEGLLDFFGADARAWIVGFTSLGFVILIAAAVSHMRAEMPGRAWLWPLVGGIAALLWLRGLPGGR